MKHLNHDERLDVIKFLDRGSLCGMSIASSEMKQIAESLLPNDCLLHFVNASLTDIAIRREGWRARLARLRRALFPQHYGKFCLSFSPPGDAATKKIKQRSNRPKEFLELLQRVLHVSAADFVHIDGGAWKRRSVSAMPETFRCPELKSGRVGMLCVYNADFADAHVAMFEVSGEISAKNLSMGQQFCPTCRPIP